MYLFPGGICFRGYVAEAHVKLVLNFLHGVLLYVKFDCPIRVVVFYDVTEDPLQVHEVEQFLD